MPTKHPWEVALGLTEPTNTSVRAFLTDEAIEKVAVAVCAKIERGYKLAALAEELREARLQLEYLDGRFPTRTTPAIIARIDDAMADRVRIVAQGVTVNPNVMGGEPCVAGTRLPTSCIRSLAHAGYETQRRIV